MNLGKPDQKSREDGTEVKEFATCEGFWCLDGFLLQLKGKSLTVRTLNVYILLKFPSATDPGLQ